MFNFPSLVLAGDKYILDKTSESPLDKEIKPVNLKGNQSQILIGQTEAEAEAPVFWSSDANAEEV